MRFILFLIFSVGVAAAQFTSPLNSTGVHGVPVVIVLGDSNASGSALVSLPHADERVEYHLRVDVLNSSNPLHAIDLEEIPLSSPVAPSGLVRHSVEGGLAKGIKGGAGKRFVILKVSRSASNLKWHWKKNGAMWNRFAQKKSALEASLAARGLTPDYRAAIWIGGTNDSDATQAGYTTMFTDFISDLRAEVGNAALKISATRDGTTATKNAIDAVAASDPLVWSVSTEGYATSDGVHFTSDALMALGESLAAPLNLVTYCPAISLRVQGDDVVVTYLGGDLESTTDFVNWTDLSGSPSPHVEPLEAKKFYRLKL